MDNYVNLQKKAADQRKQYVLTKLASIIPSAVHDRNEKIKQRKQAVQIKVASIVERVTNPEQRKQTVKAKVADIVKKASGECCKTQKGQQIQKKTLPAAPKFNPPKEAPRTDKLRFPLPKKA